MLHITYNPEPAPVTLPNNCREQVKLSPRALIF